MDPNQRSRLLAIVAGVAVALLAGDALVLQPLIKNWNTRATRLASLRKSVSDGTQLLQRENSLRESWNRMRTNTLSLEVSVAESQLLRAFEAWSRESGVAVGGIRPQWKRTDSDLQSLECRADITGNLPGITRFLYEAELDPLGIKIESIELTARDKTGDQIALALVVSGLQLRPPTR
jgi:hypothetical protein